MTRRMALTQSSMSDWEFAISRKDSWLIGARSFSPVPPVGKNEKEEGELSSRGEYGSIAMTTDDLAS